MSFWSGLNQKKGMAFLDKAGKGLKMFSWQQRPLTSSRNMKACTIKEMVITLTAFEVLVSYESVWILNLSGEWKTKEKHSFYMRWTQIRAQVARCTWGPHNARGTQMHQTITNMCPAIYVQTSSRPDFLTWFFYLFPLLFLFSFHSNWGGRNPSSSRGSSECEYQIADGEIFRNLELGQWILGSLSDLLEDIYT